MEREPLSPVTALQMEALEEATSLYEAALSKDAEAVRYLVNRGLTKETVLTNRLGVVADPAPGHELMRGYIAIPFLLRGEVVGLRFRKLHVDGPKYLQPAGSRIGLYGVDSIFEADDTLHVTEGEFDRLILTQAGLPAIGFPGASTWRPYHGRMLAGFSRIWVWADPDAAGSEFATKVINRLPMSAKAVRLQVGDVTETYLEGGNAALYELVDEELAA